MVMKKVHEKLVAAVHWCLRGPPTAFGQASLLSSKTWRSKFRGGKVLLSMELGLPIVLMLGLGIYASKVRDQRQTYTTLEDNQELDFSQDILDVALSSFRTVHIVHQPKEFKYAKEITNLMIKIAKFRKGGSNFSYPLKKLNYNVKFKFYSSEKSLDNAYKKNPSSIKIAIVFHKKSSLSYVFRTNPNSSVTKNIPAAYPDKTTLDTCRKYGDHNHPLKAPKCQINAFFYSGYLALQYLVDLSLTQYHGKNKSDIFPPVTMQNYPKHKYEPPMPEELRHMIPTYSAMCFIPFISGLLVLMLQDKENRIKDGLALVGVKNVAFWLAYFEIYLGFLGFIVTAMTIIIRLCILENTQFAIIFLLAFFYGLSLMSLSFIICTLFKKVGTATSASVYFVTIFSFIHVIKKHFETKRAFSTWGPARLISPVAFTLALETAIDFEFIGGVEWKELRLHARGEPIMWSILFLLLDTMLYAAIAWYLDNIRPNEYGVRQKLLFCFNFCMCHKSRWFRRPKFIMNPEEKVEQQVIPEMKEKRCKSKCCCCCCDSKDIMLNVETDYYELPESEYIEEVHENVKKRVAIKIRDIRKTYSSRIGPQSTFPLNGISLDIYEGQITAIIGRNGAGKTTLMNILGGSLAPTSGKCSIFDLEITDPRDSHELRQITGMCTQRDMHFDYLTVSEHLAFYGQLRGLRKEELAQEINSMLLSFHLIPIRDDNVIKLSTGQRRKLSVAIALIGSPKLILLDEPSTGVDSLTRRNIWSALRSHKSGKVILLTTHFMDEADILADRKAIIHEGVVKCVGSSWFLKMKFGIGYHLAVHLKDKTGLQRSDTIVSQYVPECLSTRQVVGKEVRYRLPQYKVDRFGAMFKEFEELLEEEHTCISDYGLSLTTLEEVFLKIASNKIKLDLDEPQKQEPNDVTPRRHRDNSTISTTSFHKDEDGSGENSSGIESEEIRKSASVTTEATAISLMPSHKTLKPSQCRILISMFGIRLKIIARSYVIAMLMIVLSILTILFGCWWFKQEVPKVKEKVTYCVGKSQYNYKNVSLAYSERSEEPFHRWVEKIIKKVRRKEYSGKFRDILDFAEELETIASFSIGAGTFIKEYNMRLNGTYLHSPIFALNFISQYHFHKMGGKGSICITHYPFRSRKIRRVEASPNAVIFMGSVFIYTASALVLEMVKDRESKIRNQLRFTGVSFFTYFFPIIFLFFIVALLNVGFLLTLVVIFKLPGFMNVYAITILAILMVLSILPTLLFTTTFSYMFEKSGSALYCLINFGFIGTCMCHFIRNLATSGDYDIDATNVNFVAVTCSFNVFYIPLAILTIIIREFKKCEYLRSCSSLGFRNYWNDESKALVIVMTLQTALFIATTYFSDWVKNGGLIPFYMSILSPKDYSDVSINGGKEDMDVTMENLHAKKYMRTDPAHVHPIVAGVQGLWKSYPRPHPIVDYKGKTRFDKEALQGASFVLQEGEIFGILGHSGSGKSTILRMMTGETFPEKGKVRIGCHNIKAIDSPAFKTTGYCTQHDALWEDITLQEHIHFFMIVRGVPKKERKIIMQNLMKELQLTEDASKKPKKLSGGTKRKLSYCLSLIGSPKLVLLDEPSAGMDAAAKRILWNTLLSTFQDGDRGSVVLATHEMDEANALCTRIGILVNGAFVSIGTPSYLKHKFGAGYTLEVKVKAYRRKERERTSSIGSIGSDKSHSSRASVASSAAAIAARRSITLMDTAGTLANLLPKHLEKHKSDPPSAIDSRTSKSSMYESPIDKFLFLQKLFPSAKMADEFGNHVVYLLPKSDTLKLSDTFNILQSLKETDHIEDYSFSQTTLEQVYIGFSKDHDEAESEVQGY